MCDVVILLHLKALLINTPNKSNYVLLCFVHQKLHLLYKLFVAISVLDEGTPEAVLIFFTLSAICFIFRTLHF
jgi:hypothetical protein